MTLVRAVIALILGLGFEAGLGKWAPGYHRYLDVLMLPVVWYALARSQRGAMLVGCAAGLLQDTWFRGGVLGIGGFSKTLLGWALGGLGARFDLNVPLGGLAAGALMTVADGFLQMALLRLLDLATGPVDPVEIAVRAALGGLLTLVVFAILNRVSGAAPDQKSSRRRG